MQLLQNLRAYGITVRIDGANLIVNPRALLTDEIRDALRAGKPGLLQLPQALMRSINRCCRARGDDDGNRAALILECLALGAWEQAELIDHFTNEAIRWERANGADRTDETPCALSTALASPQTTT